MNYFRPGEKHPSAKPLEDVGPPLTRRRPPIGQRSGRAEERQVEFHPRRPLSAMAPVHEMGTLEEERGPGHHRSLGQVQNGGDQMGVRNRPRLTRFQKEIQAQHAVVDGRT